MKLQFIWLSLWSFLLSLNGCSGQDQEKTSAAPSADGEGTSGEYAESTQGDPRPTDEILGIPGYLNEKTSIAIDQTGGAAIEGAVMEVRSPGIDLDIQLKKIPATDVDAKILEFGSIASSVLEVKGTHSGTGNIVERGEFFGVSEFRFKISSQFSADRLVGFVVENRGDAGNVIKQLPNSQLKIRNTDAFSLAESYYLVTILLQEVNGQVFMVEAKTPDAVLAESESIEALDSVDLLCESVLLNRDEVDPAALPKPDPMPSTWASQRSHIRTIDCSLNLSMTLTAAEVRLINHGLSARDNTFALIDPSSYQFSATAGSFRLSFADDEQLDDGVLQLLIAPSVDLFELRPIILGAGPEGAFAFSHLGGSENKFFKLDADYNGDGVVLVDDKLTFNYWFGKSVPEAPQFADENNDVGISVFDFTVFNQNFEARLLFPLSAL